MTTTLAALLCDACGLSHREAAEVLGVRPDTVQSWYRRQRPREASQGVLAELAAIAGRIETAAAEALAQIEDLRARGLAPDVIELGVAADDAEARSIGWPCVGAQRASLAIVVARGLPRGYRFRIVPRGTTVVTAVAADVHDRQQRHP